MERKTEELGGCHEYFIAKQHLQDLCEQKEKAEVYFME